MESSHSEHFNFCVYEFLFCIILALFNLGLVITVFMVCIANTAYKC